MPDKILAFDLSLARTGWAFGKRSTDWRTFGAQSFPVRKGCDSAHRYNDFDAWLNRHLDVFQPDLVVFEKQIRLHGGMAAAEIALGLVTRLKAACAARNIPYRCIAPTSLKKFATGSGQAQKCYMQAEAQMRWPLYNPDQDEGGDEADALWLLEWGIQGCPESEATKKKKAKKQ